MGPLQPPPWTATGPLLALLWIAMVLLEPDIMDQVNELTLVFLADSMQQVKFLKKFRFCKLRYTRFCCKKYPENKNKTVFKQRQTLLFLFQFDIFF